MKDKTNPLFSGEIGSYSGVIIHENEHFKDKLEYMYRRQQANDIRAEAFKNLSKWMATEFDNEVLKALVEDYDKHKDDDR
jgi:hypothetical protein